MCCKEPDLVEIKCEYLKMSSVLKDRVHCFSMQVVMNKCFLLNLEKKFGANLSCHFQDKHTFN